MPQQNKRSNPNMNNPYSRHSSNYRANASGYGGVKPAVPLSGSGKNQYSRNASQYSAKKSGRGKKIAVVFVCVLLLCLIGCGVAAAMFINDVNSTMNNKSEEEQQAIAEVIDPTTNFDEPFYMLLIGSDARAEDESMGARSDTNILVYVDPVSNTVSMVSIPRDTMIEIDGNMEKFNAAYSYKGAASTIQEANELCGVKISHYAEVNFEELIGLIDAVGGVEVDVPERIDDPDAGDIVIEAGLQTLNGDQALVFARSRAYVDGDFTRTSNQRLLIEALINKVLSLPVTELPGVIQKAAECVTTDFTVTEIIDLASRFQDSDTMNIYSAMVPSTTATVDGVSYVLTYQTQLDEMIQVIEQGGDPSTVDAVGTEADIREEQKELMGSATITYEESSGGYDDGPIASGGGSAYDYGSSSSGYYESDAYSYDSGYYSDYSAETTTSPDAGYGGGYYDDSYAGGASGGGGYSDTSGGGAGESYASAGDSPGASTYGSESSSYAEAA